MISISRFLEDKTNFIKQLDTKRRERYQKDFNNLMLGCLLSCVSKKDYEKALEYVKNKVKELYESENDDGTMKNWKNGN